MEYTLENQTYFSVECSHLIFLKTQLCDDEDIIAQLTADFIKPNKIQLTRYYDVYDKEEFKRKPVVIFCTLERVATKGK